MKGTGLSRAGFREIVKYDPVKHRRRSIRLKEYDYSQSGVYFVTVRTKGGECVFGDVLNGTMKLSERGVIARECWLAIPEHLLNVELEGLAY